MVTLLAPSSDDDDLLSREQVAALSGPEYYDTAANLASSNPVVSAGLMAIESNTGLAKIGNGSTNYNDLSYLGARMLALASTTSQQTGVAGTIVDVTSLTIAFDVVARPVRVVFYHPWLTAVTAAVEPVTYLRNTSDSSTRATRGFNLVATGDVVGGTTEEIITTPASYSIKASIQRLAGTGTITSLSTLSTTRALLYAEEM